MLVQMLIISMQMWNAEGDCCNRKAMEFTIPKDKTCEQFHAVRNDKGLCVRLICDDLSDPSPCCGLGKCDDICCHCTCRTFNITSAVVRSFKTYGVNVLRIHSDKREGVGKYFCNYCKIAY